MRRPVSASNLAAHSPSPAETARGTGAVSADVGSAAAAEAAEVLASLGSTATAGLSDQDVLRLRQRYGPNAVSSHKGRLVPVLWHQLRSPLLALLLTAATASYFVGQRSDALIIGVIVALSVGLGFVNEYRAEKAAEALHDQIRHETTVVRDGRAAAVDVTDLVPGDIVDLHLGDIVPADVRLLEVTGLACDESVLTGESLPVDKNTATVAPGTALAELTGCALMGTVVNAGSGRAVVVTTGGRTEFGKIAAGLSGHQLETEFQRGLRRFSMLLVYVAGSLTTSIFVINVVLHKPIMDALLFSLAIAVGITPQLLPAVRPERGGGRQRVARDPAGPHPGLRAAADRLLRRAGRHGRRVPGVDRSRQADLLPGRPRRPRTTTRGTTSLPATPGRPLQPRDALTSTTHDPFEGECHVHRRSRPRPQICPCRPRTDRRLLAAAHIKPRRSPPADTAPASRSPWPAGLLTEPRRRRC